MSFLEKLPDISTFVFDIDGVFTNASVYVQEDGVLLRRMSVRDGFAVQHALKKGYRIIAITGGRSRGVARRFKDLGITEFFDNIQDKSEVMYRLVNTHALDLGKTIYMGDDIPDLEPMRLVHLPICPLDAVPEIRGIAQYISPLRGGEGCVRDIIEKVLKVQGKWAV